jgi:hypothetical protein
MLNTAWHNPEPEVRALGFLETRLCRGGPKNRARSSYRVALGFSEEANLTRSVVRGST